MRNEETIDALERQSNSVRNLGVEMNEPPVSAAESQDKSREGDTIMVIAVLAATVAFQIGINPPGGTWQDNTIGVAGKSVFATTNFRGFFILMVFNTAALSTSLAVIMVLTDQYPFRKVVVGFTWLLYWTYGAALGLLTPMGTTSYMVPMVVVVAIVSSFMTIYWGR